MDVEMQFAEPDRPPNPDHNKKTIPLNGADTNNLAGKISEYPEMESDKLRPERKKQLLKRRDVLKLFGLGAAAVAAATVEESIRQHKGILDIVKGWLKSTKEGRLVTKSKFELNDNDIQDYNLYPVQGANLPEPLAGQTGYVSISGLKIENPGQGFRLECDDVTWKAFGLQRWDYPDLKLVLSTDVALAVTAVQGNRIPTALHQLKYVWFENQQGMQTVLLFDPGNGNPKAEVITKFLENRTQHRESHSGLEGFVGKVISGQDRVAGENRVIFVATRVANQAENIKASQLQPKNT